MATTMEQQAEEQVVRAAMISNNVRQALRSALPAPPEQFFTVSVPGKVVNFKVWIRAFVKHFILLLTFKQTRLGIHGRH